MLSKRSRQGFTLVEVLVALSIIGVLAAIGFSLSAPSREKARQSVCASQLKQLYMGVMMYSADVDAGEEISGLGAFSCSIVRPHGRAAIQPYFSSPEIQYCPDLPSVYKPKINSSYLWHPTPSDVLDLDSPGQRTILTKQRAEIDKMGMSFPMFICIIHDEVYYQPSERHINNVFVQPFVLEVSVSGSLYAGRRPYGRTQIFNLYNAY